MQPASGKGTKGGREGGRKPEEEARGEEVAAVRELWKDFNKGASQSLFYFSAPLRKQSAVCWGDESAKVREGRKGLHILRTFPSCIVKMLDKLL